MNCVAAEWLAGLMLNRLTLFVLNVIKWRDTIRCGVEDDNYNLLFVRCFASHASSQIIIFYHRR